MRTKRMTKLACVPATLTLLAATSCGTAQPGKAIPDQAAASDYVGSKYNYIVTGLSTDIIGKNGIHVREDFNVSIDEKKSNYTTTSTAAGNPQQRVDVNQNNRDPAYTFLTFFPAHSKRRYMQLGRAYAKLAKTPWVSAPLSGEGAVDDMPECLWEGLMDTCKAINTFGDAISNTSGSRVISASTGRVTTLRAEISLQTLIDQRLIKFPPSLMSRISEKMRAGRATASLNLNAENKLRAMRYQGQMTGNGHTVNVNISFSFRAGDEMALPRIPKSHDVTKLNRSQLDRFLEKKTKIDGG